MAITENTINYIIETIKKIESTMIVRVVSVKTYVNGSASYGFAVLPNDSNVHPYVTNKDGKYHYHLNERQTLDLGAVTEPVTAITTRQKIQEKIAELHCQLNKNLIEKLIAEDGTLLFDQDSDEDSKSVFILYRQAILERLKQSTLPLAERDSQRAGGWHMPAIASGSPEAGLIVVAILLLVAVITPLITISADLEDLFQSIKIKQHEVAVATKILTLGTLMAGAAMLVALNPIGGALGFAFLSMSALIAVAVLFRTAKYLINCEHAPSASLYVSQKERKILENTNSIERVETITYAINTLVEKDKSLYGPEAKSRAPFWNEKNKIEHRNLLNMITQFKSSKADKLTEAEIVKETVFVAADSILRIK